jgi:hypothetical protein
MKKLLNLFALVLVSTSILAQNYGTDPNGANNYNNDPYYNQGYNQEYNNQNYNSTPQTPYQQTYYNTYPVVNNYYQTPPSPRAIVIADIEMGRHYRHPYVVPVPVPLCYSGGLRLRLGRFHRW